AAAASAGAGSDRGRRSTRRSARGCSVMADITPDNALAVASLALNEASAYFEDAAEQLVKLAEAMHCGEDKFEAFAEHAAVVMAVKAHIDEALQALAVYQARDASEASHG